MTGASILIGLKAKQLRQADAEKKAGEELVKYMDRMERERLFLLTLELIKFEEVTDDMVIGQEVE